MSTGQYASGLSAKMGTTKSTIKNSQAQSKTTFTPFTRIFLSSSSRVNITEVFLHTIGVSESGDSPKAPFPVMSHNSMLYVCACMRVCVHVHVYVYVYVCVCVYVCIYMYMYTRVGVHIHTCGCIVVICTVQSLYYMHVHHRFFINTYIRAWWGIGRGGFFQLVHC